MTTPASSGKVVLCTGANRGLGLAILQVAALRDPTTNFILASRDRNSGDEAAQQLAKDGFQARLDVVQLDITNDAQIVEAIKFVTVKYGKLDGKCLPSTRPS